MTTKRKGPHPLKPIGGGHVQRRRRLESSAFVESRGSIQVPACEARTRHAKRGGEKGCLPRDETENIRRMCCIDKERCPCAHRVETRPPLRVFVVPVWPYSVEVHLPPARPERTPLLRIDVDNRAHHVPAVFGAPAAAAKVRDARRARVAPARAREDRGGVNVAVVEEVAGRFCVGEVRRCCVYASYLVRSSASGVDKGEMKGQQRTCHMPGLAAARKRHGDGPCGLARISLSRMPDFIPETKAASCPHTTSPVRSGPPSVFCFQETRDGDYNTAM